MKIIKAGDLKRINGIKRFTCRACGCIWEADNSEYRTETDFRNGRYFTMRCPTCARETIVHPEDREAIV